MYKQSCGLPVLSGVTRVYRPHRDLWEEQVPWLVSERHLCTFAIGKDDCKIEGNTDPFSHPEWPKACMEEAIQLYSCKDSQLIPQPDHRNRIHSFSKGDSTSPISTYTVLSCE